MLPFRRPKEMYIAHHLNCTPGVSRLSEQKNDTIMTAGESVYREGSQGGPREYNLPIDYIRVHHSMLMKANRDVI